MPTTTFRQKVHLALFIAGLFIQSSLFGLWLSQQRDEAELTQSVENSKKQNRAFVYSNAATQHYFDITVDCQLAAGDKWQRLDVMIKDTGVGISDGDLDKVLDKISKPSPTKTGLVSGPDWACCFVRKLLTYPTKKITVASQPGQGTEVAFSLFLEKAEA